MFVGFCSKSVSHEPDLRFHDESDGLQSLHMPRLQVTQSGRGLSNGALQSVGRVRGAYVRVRRIQGRKVMTEAIAILQSVVIYAGDLMLCIGALVFLWLVAMESGI